MYTRGSAEERRLEFKEKRFKVAKWLAAVKMDGLLLRRKDNFSWITCGGDHGIERDRETGVAAAWIDANGLTLLAPNNEVARLDEDELEGLNVEIVAWPWYRDAQKEVHRFIAGRRAVSDTSFAGLADQRESFAHLRYSLTRQEIERYRTLGRDAARTVESIAKECRRGVSERLLASRLEERLRSEGMEPTVLLVAADDRIDRYRHPTPTNAQVNHRAMFVVCARRLGLTAALTRIVQFGDLSMDMESRHQAVSEIDAGIIAASRPGVRGADLFNRLCDLYSEAGYPGEWELHHQGGAIGYANRDWLALPDQTESIWPNQAMAWNPSISGTKSEDTIIVVESGFEVLTRGDGTWPERQIDVDGTRIARPDILTI